MTTLLDRAQGSLLAAAAGDALGWPQEPRGGLVGGKRARLSRRPLPEYSEWLRNNGGRFNKYQETVAAGAYSDDTQLLLAVARSCLRGDAWLRHFTELELPAWRTYQRGGGRAVLAAARAWDTGKPPWTIGEGERGYTKRDYLNAGANGVAMRIAPHVLLTRNDSLDVLHQRVVLDGITTHGHPRALVGALCLAGAMRYALKTEDVVGTLDLVDAARESLVAGLDVTELLPSDWAFADGADGFAQYAAIWERTNEEMMALLRTVEDSLRQASMSMVTPTLRDLGASGESSGAGTISVAAAIYLASRSGARPINGLLQASFEPDIDTDTVASMTGALLGAIHGVAWLSGLRNVQDSKYIVSVAESLLAGRPHGSFEPRPNSERRFLAALKAGSRQGAFIDGRSYSVTKSETISEKPLVMRQSLTLDDGQTIFIDQVSKAASPPYEITSTPEGLPSPSGTHFKAAVVVTLPTRDLEATRSFYESILQAPLRADETRVLVSQSLAFVPILSERAWTADARVRLMVDPIVFESVKRRLGDFNGHLRSATVVVLTDPDDRSVTIVNMSG